MLRELQAGNLKPGDARYDEIRGLAEARYRIAYQKALEPPKKANPLKALVAVVVAAVVSFYTAGAASGWAAAAMSTTTTTVTVGVGTAGVAAAGVGTAIGAYAGAVISTGIQTGSLDKALAAGENSLKGSVAKIAVDMLAAQLGLPTSGVGGFAVKAVGNAVTSVALSGGDFGQALLQGSINAGVEIVAKDVANQIGSAKDTLGAFGVELAHAGLGCASAVARGGNSESCGAGATGAVVAHAGGEYLDRTTGRTLSDSELSFYASLGGGVAAALVGGSNNVQTNFNTGQQTGQNAVDNNLLTQRKTAIALEKIKQCTQNCDELKRRMGVDEVDGGRQKKVEDIKYQCSTRPGECTALMQDMVKTVDLLRSPETRELLGEEGVNALVQRQVDDVGKVATAIRTGWDNEARAKAMAPVLAQLAVDMSPLGTPESIAQLITGRESVSGEEVSRLWAALGVVPLGGVLRRVGEPLTDVLTAAASKLPGARVEINLADDAFNALKNVAPTPSGLINKTKLGEAAVVKTSTIDQRLIISDVAANGDKLGVKTEALVNDVLKADPNFKILDAKYRGNNGLDHLVQYTDAQTGKTMTMVIDSKQLAKNGTTSLDPKAAGGVMQLSDVSLRAVSRNLADSLPAKQQLLDAIDGGTLKKAVAFVDKATGELKIVRVSN